MHLSIRCQVGQQFAAHFVGWQDTSSLLTSFNFVRDLNLFTVGKAPGMCAMAWFSTNTFKAHSVGKLESLVCYFWH